MLPRKPPQDFENWVTGDPREIFRSDQILNLVQNHQLSSKLLLHSKSGKIFSLLNTVWSQWIFKHRPLLGWRIHAIQQAGKKKFPSTGIPNPLFDTFSVWKHDFTILFCPNSLMVDVYFPLLLFLYELIRPNFSENLVL